jgi:metal-responsive CopG/Arc/MetJ family transcriptional regulator
MYKDAISITLNQNNLKFIDSLAKKGYKSKSALIDQIIDAYRKFKLKNDLISGFKSQTNEEVKESMLGFDDYLETIDKE